MMKDFEFELDGATLKMHETTDAVIRRMIETMSAAREESVKAQLVAMGWTPPGEDTRNVIAHAEARGAEQERARWEPVVRTWLNPGKRPDYHRKTKRRLVRSWPALASAITNAIASQSIRNGQHHHERNPNE